MLRPQAMETKREPAGERGEAAGLFHLPDMTLRAIAGPLAGQSFGVAGDGAVLGRDGTIALPTGAVSRRHAALRYQHGTFFLSDLGSRNGTWVDGQRVTGERALEPGDCVQIAEHRFVAIFGAVDESRFEVLASRPVADGGAAPRAPTPTPLPRLRRSKLLALCVAVAGVALLALPSFEVVHIERRQAGAATLAVMRARAAGAPIRERQLSTPRALPTAGNRVARSDAEQPETPAANAMLMSFAAASPAGLVAASPTAHRHHHHHHGVATPPRDTRDVATLRAMADEEMENYRDARHRYQDVLAAHGDSAELDGARQAVESARARARALRLALPPEALLK